MMVGKLSKTQKWKIYYPVKGALIGGIPMSFLWAYFVKKEGRQPTWNDRLMGFATGAVPASLIGFIVAKAREEALQNKAIKSAMRRHAAALKKCEKPKTKKIRAWCERKGY